ncbi:BRCT domain-containing protein [Streptosporangium sp. LJ11]|uniref:BRCT domain-containing protein n=1 Tax=Streptosporangium sp. LJ11 TaxID=3436927 RepID=UPI003F7A9DFF
MTPPAAPGPDTGGPDTDAEASDVSELPLAGMSVVVTGAMSGALEALTRNQMNELIERAGGRSSSSVSAKTSLLVAGEKAGSKRAKAESLGVRIVGPEEFAALVGPFI